MKKAFVSTYLSLSLLLLPTTVLPFETDQFNLPPVPLADVGDEVTEYVETQLRIVVDKLNAEIVRRERCVEVRTKGCESVEKEREKLARLRSHEGLAEAFYEHIAGGNLMTTKFGKWMNSHKFRGQPARYKAPYKESIYILNPFNYATLSPTVRLYGHEFGIDKLEHLFQQGYQYYKIVNEGIKKGLTTEEATKKAIQWGQKTERTYYGLWTSGVYSNADLFANYAGLKFYQRLTEPIVIGERNCDPLFNLDSGRWKQTQATDLVKPFIANHMNEALNPSSYRITLIRSVRRSVTKYACPEWQTLSPSINELDAISKAVKRWNDQEYGFVSKDRTIRVRELCFDH
jgi:hypothetical protein